MGIKTRRSRQAWPPTVLALLVTGFFVWNNRQRNERLALGLFIAGAVIVLVLVVVVASQ
jgi:lipopolysaccharide export LptBFGC system permease protein LptF